MTTIANNVVAKLAVAFVAVAMVLSAFAPAAQAQTTEDLQQMINDLLAQVASLQGQLGGGDTMSAAGVCPYTWTRDLSTGATGADVKMLQMFLNADPDTRIAASGVGSAGMETDYFGGLTAAAVSKFQVKYRADVLSPSNLVNPTGYFGPSSRGKANALCIATAVEDEVDDNTDDSDDSDDSDDNFELGGEADLDNFDLDDGESSLEEGDEDVVVGEITVEFADGDAEISRIDLALVADSGNDEKDPWDVFDTVSLWVDGDKVAESAADDEDDYLNEDDGTLRFSGLDLVAMEDEEVEITVAVSLQNNLDGVNNEETWELDVNAMRWFDADGVATTEDADDLDVDAVDFDIEEAGASEELQISLASSNPDATDIVVDTDSDTDDVTILVADLEADDNDIELNTVIVKVETSASTTAIVDDIRVVIDGESFDAEALVSTNKGTISAAESRYVDNDVSDDAVWYVFDIDGDVVIDEGDEVAMEVVVDFNDTDDGDRYDNGATIKASITSTETAEWDAEGADDLEAGQFDGTAVGDEHVLVAEGILVPADGFEATTDTLGDNDDIGEFTLEFEVTAVEGTFYITEEATTTDQDNGVRFSVSGAGDADIVGTLTSSAEEDTVGVFTVNEGETETFTLTVTVSGASTVIQPRVTLTEVNYTDETDGLVDGGVGVIEGTYLPTPASDFRSAVQTVQAGV